LSKAPGRLLVSSDLRCVPCNNIGSNQQHNSIHNSQGDLKWPASLYASPIRCRRAKLLDVTLGKAVVLAKQRAAVPIAKGELSKFVGDYQISAQLSLNITATDEGLVVLATGQPPLQFSYEGEINGHPQFFTRAMDAQIEFIPNATDHVSTLVLHLSGAAMTGKRQ